MILVFNTYTFIAFLILDYGNHKQICNSYIMGTRDRCMAFIAPKPEG